MFVRDIGREELVRILFSGDLQCKTLCIQEIKNNNYEKYFLLKIIFTTLTSFISNYHR